MRGRNGRVEECRKVDPDCRRKEGRHHQHHEVADLEALAGHDDVLGNRVDDVAAREDRARRLAYGRYEERGA